MEELLRQGEPVGSMFSIRIPVGVRSYGFKFRSDNFDGIFRVYMINVDSDSQAALAGLLDNDIIMEVDNLIIQQNHNHCDIVNKIINVYNSSSNKDLILNILRPNLICVAPAPAPAPSPAPAPAPAPTPAPAQAPAPAPTTVSGFLAHMSIPFY